VSTPFSLNWAITPDIFDVSCKTKAVAAIRQQHKSLALSYLRSRKQFEDALTQRLGSLEILQSTLLSVEGAAENIQVTYSLVVPALD
jgi:hypothetical protein